MLNKYASFNDLLEKIKVLQEASEPPIKTGDLVQGPNGKANRQPLTMAGMKDAVENDCCSTDNADKIPMMPYPLDSAADLIADILINLDNLQGKIIQAHSNPSLSPENKTQLAQSYKKIRQATEEIKIAVSCLGALDNIKSSE